MVKFITATIPVLFAVFFPMAIQAATFNFSGCAQMQKSGNAIVARSLSMNPSVQVDNQSGGSPVTATITLENIDPDLMIPDFFNSSYGIIRKTNAIKFQAVIEAGQKKTINMGPFFQEDGDFYFVAMSDNQPQYSNQALNPVFEDIVDQMEIINPLFITNSGDLIKGDADPGIVDNQLSYFKDEIDTLSTTYLTIPGNHDYSEDWDEYIKYLGDTDYSWDYGGVHYTAVNSANEFSSGQILDTTWLENDLSSSGAEKKIVLVHHPLLSPTWAALSLQWLSSINRDNVAEILDNNTIDDVIVGHAHGYDYKLLKNSDIATITNGYYQLVTGGAGGAINQSDGYYHYNIFHVSEDGIEHWPIKKDQFDIEMNFQNNNDGTEPAVTLEMINLEEQDVPYLRPKFKLNSSVSRIFAKSNGDYLPLQSHNNGDYNVVYVETDLSANQNKMITVAKADIIHSGRTNTVYTDKTVVYSREPENDSTEVPNLKVDPGSQTTDIKNVSWASDGLSGSWQEIPAESKINTTYKFTDLEPNTVYTIKQGGSFWKRIISNPEGEAEFEFTDNIKNRLFEFQSFEKSYPSLITTAPASGGSAHIRMFNMSGDTQTQFFAFNEDVTGNFVPYWGNVKISNSNDETIVANFDKIKVLSYFGSKLASKKPYGDNFEAGLNVVIDDLNKNGKDQVVVAPKNGRSYIKVYKYKNGKLKLLAKEKVSDEKTGFNIATGQINGKGNKEIVVAPAGGDDEWIKVYAYTSGGKIKLLKKQALKNDDFKGGINIAIGSIRAKKKQDIIISSAAGNTGKIYAWYLKDNNNLKRVISKNIFENYIGGISLSVGDVNSKGKFKEEIIATSGQTGEFKVLKYKKSTGKVSSIYSKAPYAGISDINIGIANIDSDYKAEIITSPLAGGSQVKIFDYYSGFRLENKFKPYGSGFTGGVNLTP
ncbi:metallophosphoesterase [Patescibacteria group bacterium]|nr:metallophosphoesterase [Patescibacteria group bacterium]MBU1673400.1 metallophosphoesterase [Patescibacteria group bacterium]MBU1963304.1 metallophosphoesterase [Patescibacteria group bacterium]